MICQRKLYKDDPKGYELRETRGPTIGVFISPTLRDSIVPVLAGQGRKFVGQGDPIIAREL